MIDFIPEPDSVYPIIMAILKSCRHRGGCSLGSALRSHIAASLNPLGDYERVVTLSFVRCPRDLWNFTLLRGRYGYARTHRDVRGLTLDEIRNRFAIFDI